MGRHHILPYSGNEHLLGTTDSPTPKWEPKPGESVAVRDVPDEEWKALPRTLRWTKEPPAEPGYYWFRNEEVEGILQICNSVKGLYIMYHGNDEEWEMPEGEWAGPIQEPLDTSPKQ